MIPRLRGGVYARRLLLAAVLLLAVAGHVAFWYLPRERPATLDPGSAPGTLFVDGTQEVRAWLPFPHQNAAAAAGAIQDPERLLAAAARLAGLGDVELPAFGPFALPPADALAIAVDSGGENLEVTVEVYPAVAVLARLAGLVAGNPLLGGGEVSLSGRALRVAWSGRIWSLRAGIAPERTDSDDARKQAATMSTGPASTSDLGEATGRAHLGLVSLAALRGGVPPGLYRLHREGRDLVVESPGAEGAEEWTEVAELAEAQAAAYDLAFLGLRVAERAGATVLVLPSTRGTGLELPDAAVAWSGDVERWRIPGERVARLLDLDLLEAQVDAWSLLAVDRPSLDAARHVAPLLGRAARDADVSLVIWIRPRDYLPLVSAVAEVLDAIPFTPPQDVAYWSDLRTVLETIGPLDRVSVAVGARRAGARLGWQGN